MRGFLPVVSGTLLLAPALLAQNAGINPATTRAMIERSEEHTSELQSLRHLVCRRLLEKTTTQATLRLYNNNSDGTFADVSEKAGLSRSVWACGITVGEYDNDCFFFK